MTTYKDTLYLFSLVNNNDYVKLDEIINSGKKLELNRYKACETLLSQSIKVRAKECFDILINISLDYVQAIRNAIEYCSNAMNQSNYYYLKKILEKNIILDYYSIILAMNNSQLFIQLFELYNEKNETMMIKFGYRAIMNNYNITFEFIYNYMETNIPAYLETFKDMMYFQAIASDNIIVIDFLISKNLNWKIASNSCAIYFALNKNNLVSFDYLYKKYKTLPEKELNEISNITNIDCIPIDFIHNTRAIEALKLIFKLKINFNDLTPLIKELFKHQYNKYIYASNRYHWSCDLTRIKQALTLMTIIFESGWVKSNPLLLINYNQFIKYYKINIVTLNPMPDSIVEYKNTIKSFLELCKSYNYVLDTFIII